MPDRLAADHSIVEDFAGTGGWPRLTCNCGDHNTTMVRPPFMSDRQWDSEVANFRKAHGELAAIDTAQTCQDCGREFGVWHADSRLWNEVVGGDPDREAAGMLCPDCFMERADVRFLTSEWMVAGWQLIPNLRRRP